MPAEPALVRHRHVLLPVLLCLAILDLFTVFACILAGRFGWSLAWATLLVCLILVFLTVKDYRP